MNIRLGKYSLIYIIIIILYIGIRVENVSSIEKPKIYPDSKIYLSIADSSFNFTNYGTNKVPFVTPLVFKLVGGTPENIAVFNMSFSIFSWILLGFGTIKFIDGKLLKWLFFSLILMFSLSAEILLFDWNILSESISLSLMILFITSWMLYVSRPQKDWQTSLAIIFVGFLWIFTRDTNSLLVLALSVMLVTFSAIRKNLRVAIISLILFTFCMVSTQLGDISGRWIPPNLKIIEKRILTSENNLAFYQSSGMPVNSALMDMAGGEGLRIHDWYDNPELSSFLAWHLENGKKVYLQLLVSNPTKTFLDPFRNSRTLVFSQPLFAYSPKGFESVLPVPLNEILFFKFWNPKLVIVTVLLFFSSVGIVLYRKRLSLLTPLVMGLFLYPHALAVWTASGGDVNRHAYQLRVQYRLTIILLSIYIIEYLLVIIFSNYFDNIIRAKPVIAITGILSIIISLIADFILYTGDTFYLGFAQISLLGFGGLLIITSIFLHFSPEKLRIAIVGTINSINKNV